MSRSPHISQGMDGMPFEGWLQDPVIIQQQVFVKTRQNCFLCRRVLIRTIKQLYQIFLESVEEALN